jgi:hypothetical protein
MRYRVSDLPPVGVGAFTPIPSTTPAASSYGLVEVYGAPGTEPVYSPSPQHSRGLPSLTRQPPPDTAQDSDCAPDYILPSIYIASAANMGPTADAGFGMARRRYCELPVPAVDPTRLPQVAQKVPPVGGRAAMAWPRAFQRFPNRTSGTQGQ